MCFTPFISLSTALFEFVVASIILVKFPKTLINKFLVTLCYFLGLYQFTEFMLCTTTSPVFWAKIGFITYSFLPAIGLGFAFDIIKFRHQKWLVFLVPVVCSFVAVISPGFIISSACNTFFITVRSILNSNTNIYLWIYGFYYYSFISYSAVLLYYHCQREKNKTSRQMYSLILWAIIVSLLPPLILLVIFPAVGLIFPSLYCFFAVFFAVAAIIIAVKRKKRNN